MPSLLKRNRHLCKCFSFFFFVAVDFSHCDLSEPCVCLIYAGCIYIYIYTWCVQVARRFLAAVEECSGTDRNMGLFISCDPGDVLRQAQESTRRYQQGAYYYYPS
jgi:hypothetical protein